MKRMKVMLSSLLVLAVVGSALAFNAKDDVFCYYQLESEECVLQPNRIQSATDNAGGTEAIRSIPPSGQCPQLAPEECNRNITNVVID